MAPRGGSQVGSAVYQPISNVSRRAHDSWTQADLTCVRPRRGSPPFSPPKLLAPMSPSRTVWILRAVAVQPDELFACGGGRAPGPWCRRCHRRRTGGVGPPDDLLFRTEREHRRRAGWTPRGRLSRCPLRSLGRRMSSGAPGLRLLSSSRTQPETHVGHSPAPAMEVSSAGEQRPTAAARHSNRCPNSSRFVWR
jgi:hypothetical protein